MGHHFSPRCLIDAFIKARYGTIFGASPPLKQSVKAWKATGQKKLPKAGGRKPIITPKTSICPVATQSVRIQTHTEIDQEAAVVNAVVRLMVFNKEDDLLHESDESGSEDSDWDGCFTDDK